jgi:DNA mismatch repair protein MutL
MATVQKGSSPTQSDGTIPGIAARPIMALPQSVINRIAAGEVVQRPSSALKELLENSIDAGATAIQVTCAGGGFELLQVSDNGSGIRRSDLALLCERFATSKLTSFDDLASIQTFGFRGEALASISHVGKVQVTTFHKNDPTASTTEYLDGKIVFGPTPCAGVQGTTLRVTDLFYNSPVRKLTLTKPGEEYARIVDVVSKYALAFPHVAFSCKKEGSSRSDCLFQRNSSTLQNIRTLFGSSLASKLHPIEFESSSATSSSSRTTTTLPIRISGYCSDVTLQNKKSIFVLFINNRLVDSSAIRRAVDQAYLPVLVSGNRPFTLVLLQVPPSEVDVNVHPTKHEVFLLQEDFITQKIYELIREIVMRHRANDAAISSGSTQLSVGHGGTQLAQSQVVASSSSQVVRPKAPVLDDIRYQVQHASLAPSSTVRVDQQRGDILKYAVKVGRFNSELEREAKQQQASDGPGAGLRHEAANAEAIEVDDEEGEEEEAEEVEEAQVEASGAHRSAPMPASPIHPRLTHSAAVETISDSEESQPTSPTSKPAEPLVAEPQQDRRFVTPQRSTVPEANEDTAVPFKAAVPVAPPPPTTLTLAAELRSTTKKPTPNDGDISPPSSSTTNPPNETLILASFVGALQKPKVSEIDCDGDEDDDDDIAREFRLQFHRKRQRVLDPSPESEGRSPQHEHQDTVQDSSGHKQVVADSVSSVGKSSHAETASWLRSRATNGQVVSHQNSSAVISLGTTAALPVSLPQNPSNACCGAHDAHAQGSRTAASGKPLGGTRDSAQQLPAVKSATEPPAASSNVKPPLLSSVASQVDEFRRISHAGLSQCFTDMTFVGLVDARYFLAQSGTTLYLVEIAPLVQMAVYQRCFTRWATLPIFSLLNNSNQQSAPAGADLEEREKDAGLFFPELGFHVPSLLRAALLFDPSITAHPTVQLHLAQGTLPALELTLESKLIKWAPMLRDYFSIQVQDIPPPDAVAAELESTFDDDDTRTHPLKSQHHVPKDSSSSASKVDPFAKFALKSGNGNVPSGTGAPPAGSEAEKRSKSGPPTVQAVRGGTATRDRTPLHMQSYFRWRRPPTVSATSQSGATGTPAPPCLWLQGIPQVLPVPGWTLLPPSASYPSFLIRLAADVDYRSEASAFRDIANEIGYLYAESCQELVRRRWKRHHDLQLHSSLKAEPKEEQASGNLADPSAGATKSMPSLDGLTRKIALSPEELRLADSVRYGLLPIVTGSAVGTSFFPQQDLVTNKVIQALVSVEELYKVFERC